MRLRIAGQRLDDVPARADGLAGLVAQPHVRVMTRDGEHLLFGQCLDADCDLVHNSIMRCGQSFVTSSAADSVLGLQIYA